MSAYTFIFLRHAQSTGNQRNLYQGQADFPLTPLGRAQAQALALRWQAEALQVDEIITSPLLRARQTTEIIAAALNMDFVTDDIWKEKHNGSYEGRDMSLPKNQPLLDEPTPFHQHFADAESEWQVFLRAGQALHTLFQRPPGAYLIVSHGGLLNSIMLAVLGMTPRSYHTTPRFGFFNTGFAVCQYRTDTHHWRIDAINDHAHLKEL